MTSVVERARRYIAKCPASISGQGGHNAAFHVASILVHGFALGEADALALLHEWNTGCQPPWSEGDLVHKIKSAVHAQHTQPRGWLAGDGKPSSLSPFPPGARGEPVRKPVFCPMVLKRVAAKVAAISDVVAFVNKASPVFVEKRDSTAFLRWLYGKSAGEKLLIFSDMKSQGQFVWNVDRNDGVESCQLPTGDDGVWFLPQPVDGLFHPNPRLGGKMSRRSEESVTAWRYMVLESDKAEADDWLRCLIQMPLRIACICESGGRSIHALVRIDATSKVDWDVKVGKMKPVLVTLGADPGALSAVRLTRLPQALRGKRVQQLLYLNPDPDGRPIVDSGKGVV